MVSLQPQMRDILCRLFAVRFLDGFFEKSFQNIWMFQKYGLSLHRFSAF